MHSAVLCQARIKSVQSRLQDYDRNFNCGQPVGLGKEYTMELPAATAYKDLNSQSVVQQLTPHAVDSYMTSVDKKTGKDLH